MLEIDREQSWCQVRRARGEERHCDQIPRYFERFTALQERSLRQYEPGTVAYRAIYMHSLGASVMVRVMRTDAEIVLVAKVLEGPRGPLSWIRTRALSEAQWETMRQWMESVPEGSSWYLGPPEARGASAIVTPDCHTVDGASIQIERFEGGKLQITRGTYQAENETPCAQRRCCNPAAYQISRIFDDLVTLFPCAN